MCNASCIIFGVNNLSEDEIKGKGVIEVGSLDSNGSLRSIIKKMKPAQYIGVDIERGPGVDMICNAENLVDRFNKESFDVVICTELLEHVKDWRRVISNLKNICKTNGIILITTRSYGFAYHAYPYDFWRYELEDMKNIFSDFIILALERDRQGPGVFAKVQKPDIFIEKDLSNYYLFCILVNKRIKDITSKNYRSLNYRKLIFKVRIKNFLKKFLDREFFSKN